MLFCICSDFGVTGADVKVGSCKYLLNQQTLIKWIDENKKAVYEWDEDLRFGPYYHVNGDDGNTRLPNSTGETHFFPGDTFGK